MIVKDLSGRLAVRCDFRHGLLEQAQRAGCLAILVCLVLAGAACSSTQPPGSDRVQPTYDETTGRLKKLAYDANGDGVPETWGYMDGVRVIRVEADENQDGKVDRWEYHRQDALADGVASPMETIERVERATRHDGKVSRWEFFERGSLVRVEEDTDGDGRIDKWETYSNGALASMALDTQGLGKPERTLIYKRDGSLDRIEGGTSQDPGTASGRRRE